MKKRLIILAAFAISSLTVQAQVDRSSRPQAGPLPEVQLSAPKSFQLDNGLKVLVVEDHKLPRVSATLTLDNYPVTEGEKAGVSSLMGDLLGTGSKNMSKSDFDSRVDFLGARLSFWSTGARAFSLSKYFNEILGMMADATLNPVFSKEEFDKVKQQTSENLKSQEKSAKAISSEVTNALAYGKDHPYGEIMTQKTLGNISLDDVKENYTEYFRPNHAYLIIVGDVKFKKVKKEVKKLFSSWERAVEPRYSFPTTKNVEKTEIDFVDVSNAVQSEIKIVSTIELKKSNPDYHALLVANQIFGGDFSSYLNMNLREAHGWTYGARSSISPDKYIGEFMATSTSVRNSVTDSAIVESMKELDKILNEVVTDENLKRVKAKYAGNFVMGMQKPSTVARYALDVESNKLDKDFYRTYLQNINAVTKEDIQRVAKKYFLKDNLRIVIAGKGKEILESLEALGYPVKYFDREANEVTRPEYKKPLPAGLTAEKVISDYMDAIGGKAALAKVKNVHVVYEASMGPQTLTMEKKSASPNKEVSSLSMNGMVMQKSVFNGKTGYQMVQGQKIDFTADELTELKASSKPFEILNTTGKLVAIEKVNDRDAYVVQVDETKSLFFDVESKLKVKESTTTETPQGPMTQSVEFSDYKTVKTVKIPNKIMISFGPRTLEFNGKSMKINSKSVKSADFK
jgi:predicted Zn-dependent peptidase